MYLTTFRNPFKAMDRFFEDFSEENLVNFSPKANITEEKDAYHIDLDLPGVDKGDVEIEVKDNHLVVKGERKSQKEKTHDGYLQTESSYGAFERSWTIGEGIDIDKINAASKDGVFYITLPKKKEVIKKQEPIKIEVK